MDADEVYLRCSSPELSPLLEAASPSFHRESAPYLVSTEFPWLGIPRHRLKCRSVLTVAGSGDLPLFFLAFGARRIAAVDVSLHACYFSELKRAVLRHLEWEAALRFFLADLVPARGFLQRRGIPWRLGARERSQLYGLVRAALSRSARDHWDRRLTHTEPGRSPFAEFRGLAALCFLDHIPYLAGKEGYETWRETSAPYPLLNLPLEHAAAASRISFDVIYCSNVIEYWRDEDLASESPGAFHPRLGRFLGHCMDVVAPGGELYFYLFTSASSDSFRSIWHGTAPLRSQGWRGDVVEMSYDCGSIAGSRFRNTLLRHRKPASS